MGCGISFSSFCFYLEVPPNHEEILSTTILFDTCLNLYFNMKTNIDARDFKNNFLDQFLLKLIHIFLLAFFRHKPTAQCLNAQVDKKWRKSSSNGGVGSSDFI